VPVGPAKFDPNRCNESPLRGEKPDFWPVCKNNTGSLPLCGILPVIIFDHNDSVNWSTDIGDALPLDEAAMRTLIAIRVQLLDLIDPNHAFVTELANVGCITWPQREYIVNIVQPRDRNDKLLEFLRRRSVADFNRFFKVLIREQAHIVPKLIKTGGEIFVLD